MTKKKSVNLKPYYITTPIYYPSGSWHIGHCYTTVICDALARFHKMCGEEVFFLTGTDEHGQKIEKNAKEQGLTPLQFIDPLVSQLKDMWRLLDINYDRFIRTTDKDHEECVQKIYQKLYESGDIYKSEYEGHYCTPCEAFWTESQLKNGRCPDCGREVTLQKEESYFFRLSKYAPAVLKLYEDNPEFLQPKSRVNEMVNNFLKAGLTDLCVSRTTVKWGVPLPFDKKHCAYVWIDALSNYISALGYGTEHDELYKKFWPANLHMVGKEIVRFHAIIWPAILMALGEPIPKQIYGHGWLLIGGDKLSKSKQDAVKDELTDPYELVKRYGTDAVRYFLLREIPFGSDGEYTNERLLTRINADLANDLGNLVSRTTAMIGQYFGGSLPPCGEKEGPDGELEEMAAGLFDRVKGAMDRLNAPDALGEIFALVSRANKYIDETTPWILSKDEGKRARLGTVLYHLAEVCRISAIMLKPFLTKAPSLILQSFSCAEDADFSDLAFGGLKAGAVVTKLPPIFPRIDIKKELAEVEKLVSSKKPASTPASHLSPMSLEIIKKFLDLCERIQIRVIEDFGGKLPAGERKRPDDKAFFDKLKKLLDRTATAKEQGNMSEVYGGISELVNCVNKYIDAADSSNLNGAFKDRGHDGTVLHEAAEACCRIASVLKHFHAKVAEDILKSFSCPPNSGNNTLEKLDLKAQTPISRIDIKKELAEVEKLVSSKKEAPAPVSAPAPEKEQIGIDDFAKVELKVGEVIACERVEKSKKLLHETVKIGDEIRSVVSGIAGSYTPEEMVGKKVIVVTNLKPAKLCGVRSEGMILCAEDKDGNLALVTPEKDMPSGGGVR